MEVSLKDESGVSANSLLEKSIALTNEIQVKKEVPAVDILEKISTDLEPLPENKALTTNEENVPVQEKIANAVTSAVGTVVDGVKGLVESVTAKSDEVKETIISEERSQVTEQEPSIDRINPLAVQEATAANDNSNKLATDATIPINLPPVPTDSTIVVLIPNETQPDVKVEQLSPTVCLVQDKFLVETIQSEQTNAVAEKPADATPSETEATSPSESKTETVVATVEETVEKVIEAVKESVAELVPEIKTTPTPEPAQTEDLPPPLPASPPPEEKLPEPAPLPVPSPEPIIEQSQEKVEEIVEKVVEKVEEQVSAIPEKTAEIEQEVEKVAEEVAKTNIDDVIPAVEDVVASAAKTVEEVTTAAEEAADKQEEEQGGGESLADVPKDLVDEVAAMTVVESSATESDIVPSDSAEGAASVDGGGNE